VSNPSFYHKRGEKKKGGGKKKKKKGTWFLFVYSFIKGGGKDPEGVKGKRKEEGKR